MEAKPLILVIEDNSDTRKYIEAVLNREFQVISAENAVTGIEYARTRKPSLIVLDIILPVLNGYDACNLLKNDPATKNIPVIFLSSKNTVGDITHGLTIGADDYLSKPFDYKELIARIYARLRERTQALKAPKTVAKGQLELNLETHEVFFKNKSIEITQTEFDILRILIDHSGEVVPRDKIIQAVWKEESTDTQKRTIDVHIRAIRKKMPEITRHITSVYGIGYKFEA